MPVANGTEKVFPGAGTKPGIEAWRIENFKPVKCPDINQNNAKLHKGDSYIILQMIAVGKEAHIFFWLGKETSQDESGAAAQLSVTLDDELGGYPVQHREVQENESKKFISLFKRMSLHKGGFASGFKEGKKKFEKALIRVKGKRKVYASQVPLSIDSLNNGDCFVLDSGRRIFAWLGKECNMKEKLNAITYARELRDEERAGLATVTIIDKDTTGAPEVEEEFFLELTGNRRVVPITKEAGELNDDAQDEIIKLNLYRVNEDSTGNITMKETGSKPLKREDLDSDDAFILETGVSVYVWLGRKATRMEKNKALKHAEGFLSARQLNPCTPVKVVKEELEPTEFKQYFGSWETVRPYGMTQTYQAGRGIVTQAQLDKRSEFEVTSMHDRKVSVTSNNLPDQGDGSVRVFRVKGFQLEEITEQCHGVFYSGDCYVIEYTYRKNSKERHIIYFWLGNDSTADEQGAAAAGATALDDKYHGEPYQVRVCEGKEPEHFFMIFNHCLTIYQGGHASGFRNLKSEGRSSETRLLQVRLTGGNCRIVEVTPVAQSLNSSDAFALHDASVGYVWVGKGSIGDEKEAAKQFLENIGKLNDIVVVQEGNEDNAFWNLLGGKADYGSAKQIWEKPDVGHPARLFHCSNASGRFRVEEILDFSQEDLEEDDVMILDAWSQLFVWVGKDARKDEKREAIKTAVEYVKTDPRGRNPNKVTMSVIKQGAEPVAFKSYFLAWEPQMWNKKMSYEDQLNAIRQDNSKVDENAWSMTEFAESFKPKCYPLAVLQKKGEELPEDVQATQKEMHLDDTEFQQIFKMTKQQWEKFPQWKKNEAKKAHDLF